MSWDHTGNVLNSITQEEHDGDLNAKRVNIVAGAVGNATVNIAGSATIFAVVNSGSATDPKIFIGLTTTVIGSAPTLYAVVNSGEAVDPKIFIGLTTTVIGSAPTIYAVVNTQATAASNVTLDPGSRTGIVGNVTLSDSKTFIGLTTTVIGNSVSQPIAVQPPPVGYLTTSNVGNVTIDSGNISLRGNVTLSDSKTFIGLVTVGNTVNSAVIGNVTISDSKGFIGLVTVVQGSVARTITGNVTLSDSKTYIGLVTAWTRNAGSAKTLAALPITLSTASILTVVTPATSNAIYITSLMMSANASVRVSIKSGVTYLSGNASIGIALNPGGGFAQTGGPDSPIFIGCASGPLIIEKFDLTGTIANVGGSVTYFQE